MFLFLELMILTIYLAIEFISGNEAKEQNIVEEKQKQLEREAMIARSEYVTRKVLNQVQSSKATLAPMLISSTFHNRVGTTKRENFHGAE